MSNISQVLEHEQRRMNAMLAGNAQALETLLDAELTWVHSSGAKDDRSTYVGKIRRGELRYLSMTCSDVETTSFDTAVLITGVSEVVADVRGTRKHMVNRFCNVWRRAENGHWTMVYWQSTPDTTANS